MSTKTRTEFSIPTIDLSQSFSTASGRKEIVHKINQACLSSGFFQLIGHGIPRDLQDAVFKGAEALFKLSSEQKVDLDMKKGRGRGYEVLAAQSLSRDPNSSSLPDHKEGFYIGREVSPSHPLVQNGAFLIGPNQWPEPSLLPEPLFREVMTEYYESVLKLAGTVLELIEAGLAEDEERREEAGKRKEPFDGIYQKEGEEGEDIIATLRLLHYPPSPSVSRSTTVPKQLGAGPHTDFGFITLLMQDSIGGLQVLDPSCSSTSTSTSTSFDDQVWHPVPPNPDAYVVNIGDMLQMYTNGRFKSSVHRVVLSEGSSGGSRYSVPFFFDGRGGFVLKRRGTQGGEEEEEEVTVEGYMRERFKSTYKS